MKIIVLGGDGFCGWPTCLHLSLKGHDVLIIDNLSRRNIDNELEVESLTPIAPINKRIDRWFKITNKKIYFYNIDIAKEYELLKQVVNEFDPDTIVHFAEQRSAPYSMKSSKHKRYTVDNNVSGTNNLLSAVVELGKDIHIVHLGTMGVYGYGTAGMKIPEGYLSIYTKSDENEYVPQKILYPARPGSIYHLTKTQDQLMFAYYNKNDSVRITDLHQGIVWGTETDETSMHEDLINRFDYDGDYGTVLNRFLMQATIGCPLTVHGSGGQTRAFIHIKDTVKCIEIAINNPPCKGDEVLILNQMTETHNVKYLANLVSKLLPVDVNFLENPRNEDDTNELHVANDTFLDLGLNPITLEDGLLNEISEITKKYKNRVDETKILCTSAWNSERANAISKNKK